MAAESKGSIIRINTREALLKRRLRRHLASLGYTRTETGELSAPGTTKDVIRQLHRAQRREIVRTQSEFIAGAVPRVQDYFASGSDVDVDKIAPRIERVFSGTWQADLFRVASLTWSVPVSSGFGRRLRFLVWDDHNGKLVGIFAIGDPVFNLAVRDNHIEWTANDRAQRLVNVMDAYVLGAVPPYNLLLGGKLVACIVRSLDVYDEFRREYGDAKGIISKQKKNPQLLAVTTSSSMGRSSIYNRLKIDGVEYFQSLGYSGGWGHFHIPDKLFVDLRDYLRDNGHYNADQHKFGDGPNWRIRAIRSAMTALGFKGDVLKHGIQREVFISQYATNALTILRTGSGRAKLNALLGVPEIGVLAVNRWVIGRAERRPEYQDWHRELIPRLIKYNVGMQPSIEKSSIAI